MELGALRRSLMLVSEPARNETLRAPSPLLPALGFWRRMLGDRIRVCIANPIGGDHFAE